MGNPDQLVLQKLLDEVSGRVAGAIDIWTLASLGQIPHSHAFLRRNASLLNSFVMVFRTIAIRDDGLSGDACLLFLDKLTTGCQQLSDSLLTLEEFRDLREEEIRFTCLLLAQSYQQIWGAITQISQSLELNLDKERRNQQNQYHLGILHSLFDLFMQEREKGEVVAGGGKDLH